jgi:hypothetical protein
MVDEHPSITREKKTVEAMIHIYCKSKHETTENFVWNALSFLSTPKCGGTSVFFRKKAPVASV